MLEDVNYYSNLKLQRFPEEIFQMFKYIKNLNISNNEIEKLPIELLNLKKLAILNLTSNLIKQIEIDISLLPTLKELYIGFNQLNKIPN